MLFSTDFSGRKKVVAFEQDFAKGTVDYFEGEVKTSKMYQDDDGDIFFEKEDGERVYFRYMEGHETEEEKR